MNNPLPAPPLLLITDRQGARGDLHAIVATALAGGCRWIMVREKDLSTSDLAALAARIVAAGRAVGAAVTVNGDVEAARIAGAAGVHLQAGGDIAAARRALGPAALVGLSTHSIAEALAADAAGADYVTLSPIFLSGSKPGYGPALGTGALRQASGRLAIPVIALAGIDAAHAGDCIADGAAGIAVMGGVMRAADPAATVRALIAAIASVGKSYTSPLPAPVRRP